MDFLDILRSDGSIIVNKSLARVIGLDAAVLFSEIVSKFKYHEDRNELTDGRWFYFTEEKLEQNTTFKRSVQDKAIKKLIDLGLISKKIMGMPSKRYFTIYKDSITAFLKLHLKKIENKKEIKTNNGNTTISSNIDKIEQPSLSQINNQACPEITTNNTKNNTKNNKENNNTKNNNLSIYNTKITGLNVNEPVKKILSTYQKRLTDYDLKSIEKLFELEIIPDIQFEEVLVTVLESNYDNLFKYLRKSLYKIKSKIKFQTQEKIIPFPTEEKKIIQSKTKNVSNIPEWIQKQIQNENKKQIQEDKVSWDQFIQIQNLLIQLGELSEEQAQKIIKSEKIKRNNNRNHENTKEIKIAY